jgi:Flp pilus assembly protein TadG
MTMTTIKRLKEQKGAALVEAAITIPILLLISVGIFEFGRAYQTWQVLTNASREGARLAVIEGSTDSDIRTRVNQYLVDGGLTSLGDSYIPIDRNVPVIAGATTCPCGTRVNVNYPYQFMVLNPVVRLIAPSDTTGSGTYTMATRAFMRNE